MLDEAAGTCRPGIYTSVMAYDPLDSSKNREPSEYGGSNGSPQPPTGPIGYTANEPPGHMLSPAEKRRIVTQEAIRSAGVMEDLPPTDEHYDAVLRLAKDREQIYRSGHTLEDALSDAGPQK
jgi:hypothetical protein